MKAIVCSDFGPIQNIEYKDVKEPIIQSESVIINVKSVGVNFPDGLLVQGKYQLKPETPFIPGMEVAGEIIRVGSSVKNFKIGDRVTALSQLSGYAEQAVVQEKKVFKIPPKMSFDDSCALLCAYGTSHYALKQRAKLQKNELLVVLGASGSTGIAAIQIGKIMGAKVIAVSSNSEKQKIAKNNGADISIGYDESSAFSGSSNVQNAKKINDFAINEICFYIVYLVLVFHRIQTLEKIVGGNHQRHTSQVDIIL